VGVESLGPERKHIVSVSLSFFGGLRGRNDSLNTVMEI
jgi:hypothetical protein